MPAESPPHHRTSSEPSAQSWSPSHFHLPAMQRPLAHENSLSEQGRGAGDRKEGGVPLSTGCGGGRAPWLTVCGGRRMIGKLFGAMALGRRWARSQWAEPKPPSSSSPGLPAGTGVHRGITTATQTQLWQLPAVPGPHTIPPRALLQEGTQRSPGQAWQSPHACVATSQGGGDRAPHWAGSWHRAHLQDHGTVWCPSRDGSWDLSPPQWCRTHQGRHPSWLGEQKPIGVDLGAGGVQAE